MISPILIIIDMKFQHLYSITGEPGTGKTSIGNYIAESFKYKHVDLEDESTRSKFLNNFATTIDELIASGENIIVTWGFEPYLEFDGVALLKEKGFKIIWFDGDRKAAYQEYIRREEEKYNRDKKLGISPFTSLEECLKIHKEAYDAQIKKIDESDIVKKLNPVKINSFNIEGKFRGKKEIANDILSLC